MSHIVIVATLLFGHTVIIKGRLFSTHFMIMFKVVCLINWFVITITQLSLHSSRITKNLSVCEFGGGGEVKRCFGSKKPPRVARSASTFVPGCIEPIYNIWSFQIWQRFASGNAEPRDRRDGLANAAWLRWARTSIRQNSKTTSPIPWLTSY